MVLRQIINPRRDNSFIWLNAAVLICYLIIGLVNPFAVVMAYFLETLAIGIVHALKLIIVAKYGAKPKSKPKNPPLIMVVFFFLHYTFFVAVQSIFVFVFFQFADDNIKEPFNLIENYAYVFTLKGMGFALLTMFGFLLIQTYITFIRTKRYKFYTVDGLFFQPYLRIFIQQFTVLFAMFFVIFFPEGIVVAVLLILIRLFIDLVGVYITESDKNKRKLAQKLAKHTEENETELYNEMSKFF